MSSNRLEALVSRLNAQRVGAQGVVQRVVEGAQRQVGLRQRVVRLHAVGRALQALSAVGYCAVPLAELEAGHGAVGVEGCVGGVDD